MRDANQITLDYLQTHTVLTLATHGTQGIWAAAVFYVNQQFNLYFLSAAHTRHALNIANTPQVAATIQENYKDWTNIKGIQLEGVARLLVEADKEQAIAHYVAKYPFVASSPQIKPALQRVNWYRIEPTALYLIDNSQGLGHREAINLFQS